MGGGQSRERNQCTCRQEGSLCMYCHGRIDKCVRCGGAGCDACLPVTGHYQEMTRAHYIMEENYGTQQQQQGPLPSDEGTSLRDREARADARSVPEFKHADVDQLNVRI